RSSTQRARGSVLAGGAGGHHKNDSGRSVQTGGPAPSRRGGGDPSRNRDHEAGRAGCQARSGEAGARARGGDPGDTAEEGRDVLSEREFLRLFTAEAGWDPEGEG